MLRSSIKPKEKRETRKLSFLLYRMLYGPLTFVRAGYRQLLILLSMFIFGTWIFSRYEGLPGLLALFASVSTVTTIGLFTPNNGNVYAMNRNEVILIIVLMIVSVGSGASLVQSTVSMAISERGKAAAQKRLVKRLKKQIIIYGYSHMGKYITQRLEELGYDYVVITRIPDVYNELLKNDLFVVLETETDIIGALKSAGIEKASLVIVADVNDSDNMRFILTTRKLRPDIRIHTVVHDPSLTEMEKDAGANVVIPATATVGELLAFSADNKDLVGVVFTQNLKSQSISEFTIHTPSTLIGKKLHDVAETSKIIGAVRNGKVDPTVFNGTFTLQEGDTLLILGDTSSFKKHLEKIAPKPHH
ncbi:MAG: potassium channel family protein [Candidatus Bathyarchaeia archaeon]